jgi:hypothetical protein
MAANNDCTGVTIESDSASNGTAWYIIPNSNGTIQLGSRYCANSFSDIEILLR